MNNTHCRRRWVAILDFWRVLWLQSFTGHRIFLYICVNRNKWVRKQQNEHVVNTVKFHVTPQVRFPVDYPSTCWTLAPWWFNLFLYYDNKHWQQLNIQATIRTQKRTAFFIVEAVEHLVGSNTRASRAWVMDAMSMSNWRCNSTMRTRERQDEIAG